MALSRLAALRQQSNLSDQEELHGTFYCVHTQPKFGATFLQGWLYVFDSAIVFDANLLAINRVQCIISYQNVRVIRKRTLLRINNTIAVEWEDSAGACHYEIFTSFMFGSRGKAFDALMEQWSRACGQASMPTSCPSGSSGGSSSCPDVCSAKEGRLSSTNTSSGCSHLLTPLRQRRSTAYEPGTAVVDAAAEAVEPRAANEAVAAFTTAGDLGRPSTEEQQEPIIRCSASESQGTQGEAPYQPTTLSASEQRSQPQSDQQQLQHCASLQWSDCSGMPAVHDSPPAAAAVGAGQGNELIKCLLGSVKAVSCTALRTLCNTVMCRCARPEDAAAPRCKTEHSASHIPGWITVVLGMQLMLLWCLLSAMHRVVRLQEQTMLLSMQHCWNHSS